MSDVMDVPEVARHLGVSERRIRALLAAQVIPGEQRRGRWEIPAHAVADFAPRSQGRPMAQPVAWACLSVLSGQDPVWINSSHRRRLRLRMVEKLGAAAPDERADAVRSWCSARADLRRLWAFAPALEEVRDEGRLVLGGAAGASNLHDSAVEAYVEESDAGRVLAEYGISVSGAGLRKPNLVLHVVADLGHVPRNAEPHRVAAAVAAVDLIEAGDPRAAHEGRQLLADAIQGWLDRGA